MIADLFFFKRENVDNTFFSLFFTLGNAFSGFFHCGFVNKLSVRQSGPTSKHDKVYLFETSFDQIFNLLVCKTGKKGYVMAFAIQYDEIYLLEVK